MKPTEKDLTDFVVREARLIDERKFLDWLALFAEDGIYWMPLEWDQEEEHLTTSLLYEDMLLLRTRVQRLEGERTFSQKPKSRCQHLLQAPQIDSIDHDANLYQTFTPFHYAETRFDEQVILAGWARHSLSVIDGELKIRKKRVDIVNCDAPHRNIQLFI
ncbi:MAG: aromatic-ring-hydroxylating dioxygenase subunit beta [Rhizobiaceae bacterium]